MMEVKIWMFVVGVLLNAIGWLAVAWIAVSFKAQSAQMKLDRAESQLEFTRELEKLRQAFQEALTEAIDKLISTHVADDICKYRHDDVNRRLVELERKAVKG